MAELLLDERIMWWVFLPIVYVTFILTVVRMFFSKYQSYKQQRKPVNNAAAYREHIDKNILTRCENLGKKHFILSEEAFNARRNFLCKPETGYLTREREAVEAANPMAQMQNMM